MTSKQHKLLAQVHTVIADLIDTKYYRPYCAEERDFNDQVDVLIRNIKSVIEEWKD